MEVLLDTNFIISCLMKKIDFLEELEGMGFVPVLPREVLQEMKDLRNKNKTSHKERVAIDMAFEMFSSGKMKKTSFGQGKVDEYMIKKGKEGIYIATLDKGIKRNI